MKTVNRGMLLRRAKSGKLWGKCDKHLTDDYVRDAANGFGKMTEYKKVAILPNISEDEKIKELQAQQNEFYNQREYGEKMRYVQCEINRKTREIMDKFKEEHEDCIFLYEDDFKSSVGGAYYSNDESKTINFRIHSNLYYSLKIDE